MARPRGILLDVGPLRESPAFRELLLGGLATALGIHLSLVAVLIEVYQITRSSWAVGAVGLFTAVPALLLGLFGGTLADAVDRRSLLIGCSAGSAVIALALTAHSLAGWQRVYVLYGLVAAQSVIGSVGAPARRSLTPRFLPRERLPAAAALHMLAVHTGGIGGPLAAALLIRLGGLPAAYLACAASCLIAAWTALRLPPTPADPQAMRPGWAAVVDGLRYVRRHSVVRGVFLADLNATLLAFPVALFPAIADQRFGGAEAMPLLNAALATGGMLGAVCSGPAGRVSRQGLGMLVAGAGWGLSLAAFGAASELWLALAALSLAGALDTTSMVFLQTMVQTTTEGRYLGRVSAAEHLVSAHGPALGNVRAGAVAELLSPAAAAVAGGLACAIGAGILAAAVPGLRRHRLEGDPAR